jgi:hypothetical protein
MVIQDKPNQALGSLEPGKWFRPPASPQNYKRIWISPRWTGDFTDLELADGSDPGPSSVVELRRLLPMKNWNWQFSAMIPKHESSTSDRKSSHLPQIPSGDILRSYLIFLENWRSGHYFEIDGCPIVHWVAGDTVLWQNSVDQILANVGDTPLRILKITGIIDPLDHRWRLQHFNDAIF